MVRLIQDKLTGVAAPVVGGFTGRDALLAGRRFVPSRRLGEISGEFFSNFCDGFMRRGPVRVACIAVEDNSAGFECGFEAFPIERNCLPVVVRTCNFEIHLIGHGPYLPIIFSSFPSFF